MVTRPETKSHEARFRPPSVLVVGENEIRTAIIRDGLSEAGLTDIVAIFRLEGLARAVAERGPDAIIIGLANPDRDLVAHLCRVTQVAHRPVAIFVDQSEPGTLETAIEAGVSAFIVNGLGRDRVKPILDMAVARFKANSRLKRELEAAREALEDRKAIDRAKARLQCAHGLAENEAYHFIRQRAMRENRRMGEIARAILSAAERPAQQGARMAHDGTG